MNDKLLSSLNSVKLPPIVIVENYIILQIFWKELTTSDNVMEFTKVLILALRKLI